MASVSALRQLANIISASVDRIDAAYKDAGLSYPDMSASYDPTTQSEKLAMTPELVHESKLIVAAAGQISALAHVPALTMMSTVMGFHIPSALRCAAESNTTEILRDHPEGLHVKDIAARNGMDPSKVARMLRILATNHIYEEVSRDVFRNNRLSSLMDTGKTIDELKARPLDKHIGNSGFAALVEHCGDEMFKCSAYLTDVWLDPELGSRDSTVPPHSLAFNTKKTAFEWYEEPGNKGRLIRFGVAMQGSKSAESPTAILKGFKWDSLPADSVIVDVGGGTGHVSLIIAKENPMFRYVVQDRAAVIPHAKDYWLANLPSALEAGRVEFQGKILNSYFLVFSPFRASSVAFDLYAGQTVKNAAVFMMRFILHDYGYKNSKIMLTRLREAAAPHTKLLIVEQVAPYACPTEDDLTHGTRIPGAGHVQGPPPPAPLLANLGKANNVVYCTDMQMAAILGGEERTLGGFVDLLSDAGWKVTEVFAVHGTLAKQIWAVPV
ncbi:S-adenosyl-L-methionine-dependent methyltransferase [Fistulina hepatica ATCC 64428]|uniref:S-adenosyl-L-methionine-dependent methyltransferase n=1 Tax=Fistulina hepatica ATCC 64428 TaxID=1128425 RepID=A0A0D7ANS8_9AGAR|nr:S-adenosyl-L-methionine-dependent methyltransferase [Fistulina hepatica ATCC 64428]